MDINSAILFLCFSFCLLKVHHHHHHPSRHAQVRASTPSAASQHHAASSQSEQPAHKHLLWRALTNNNAPQLMWIKENCRKQSQTHGFSLFPSLPGFLYQNDWEKKEKGITYCGCHGDSLTLTAIFFNSRALGIRLCLYSCMCCYFCADYFSSNVFFFNSVLNLEPFF